MISVPSPWRMTTPAPFGRWALAGMPRTASRMNRTASAAVACRTRVMVNPHLLAERICYNRRAQAAEQDVVVLRPGAGVQFHPCPFEELDGHALVVHERLGQRVAKDLQAAVLVPVELEVVADVVAGDVVEL